MSRTGNRDCSHGKWQRIQNTAWESLQVSSFYSYLLTTQLLKQQQQRKSCYCLTYAMRPPCADQYCCRNPPEVRLAPCNLAPPSNSREQHGVIPGSCPWEKPPLSTMEYGSIFIQQTPCINIFGLILSKIYEVMHKKHKRGQWKNGERECIADISLDTTGSGVLFSSWCTF